VAPAPKILWPLIYTFYLTRSRAFDRIGFDSKDRPQTPNQEDLMGPTKPPNPKDKRRRFWLVLWDDFYPLAASERHTLNVLATYDLDTVGRGQWAASDSRFLWDTKEELGWDHRTQCWRDGSGQRVNP